MLRRYSEFDKLRNAIADRFKITLPLPEKSMRGAFCAFTWTMTVISTLGLSKARLERRAEGLSEFLYRALVEYPALRDFPPLYIFLQAHEQHRGLCETVAAMSDKDVQQRIASFQSLLHSHHS